MVQQLKGFDIIPGDEIEIEENAKWLNLIVKDNQIKLIAETDPTSVKTRYKFHEFEVGDRIDPSLKFVSSVEYEDTGRFTQIYFQKI